MMLECGATWTLSLKTPAVVSVIVALVASGGRSEHIRAILLMMLIGMGGAVVIGILWWVAARRNAMRNPKNRMSERELQTAAQLQCELDKMDEKQLREVVHYLMTHHPSPDSVDGAVSRNEPSVTGDMEADR